MLAAFFCVDWRGDLIKGIEDWQDQSEESSQSPTSRPLVSGKEKRTVSWLVSEVGSITSGNSDALESGTRSGDFRKLQRVWEWCCGWWRWRGMLGHWWDGSRSSAMVENISVIVERLNVGDGRVVISQYILSIRWVYLGISPLNVKGPPLNFKGLYS